MSDVQENYGINISRCQYFATLFLGDTSLTFCIRGGFNGSNDGEKIKVDRLHHAFEVTVREIAFEHVCFSQTDTVVVENGRMPYYLLSQQLLEPLALTQNGKKVKFEVGNMSLLVENDGEYEFTYSYMPKLSDEEQWIPYTHGRLTERIIALGTCAHYCLMAGRYNDAVAFDSQYKDALNSIKKSFVKRKVKKRRWL